MKVYITGVRGYVGVHLASSLEGEGIDVLGCDLMEPETKAWEAFGKPRPRVIDRGWIEHAGFMQHVLEIFKPDVVVHLAARSTVENGFDNPEMAFETNVLGTVRILEACRKLGTPVVVASTDKAYGGRRPPFYEDDSLKPRYPYDVSKAGGDMAALCYAKTYKMPVTVTRSCNIYGPGDLHWNRLVPRSFRELAQGERPVMYGGMERVRREWLYIDDCVAAYKLLIHKILEDPESVSGLAVNFGTGEIRTLREMVQRILAVTGSAVEPIVGVSKFEELGDEWLDHYRLERLGWEPKVPLDQGLKTSWDWYREYVTTHAHSL